MCVCVRARARSLFSSSPSSNLAGQLLTAISFGLKDFASLTFSVPVNPKTARVGCDEMSVILRAQINRTGMEFDFKSGEGTLDMSFIDNDVCDLKLSLSKTGAPAVEASLKSVDVPLTDKVEVSARHGLELLYIYMHVCAYFNRDQEKRKRTRTYSLYSSR